MSEYSSRLTLPLMLPSQAQKHVTHNEALVRLDALVQLVLEDTGVDLPPALPAEGLVWGIGAAPSGDWAAHAGDLAQWLGGAWTYFTPEAGWRAWHAAQGALVVFDGTGWVNASGSQNIPGLGINSSWDTTNRLTVSSDASLFSGDSAGHQLKVNKAAGTDTASLLFQSGFTGYAEMGLAGNTDFSIKVSPDGSTWTSALEFDAATGQATGAAVQSGAGDTTAGKLARVDHTYGPATVLGAVSQTAGVPTGAVIERGTNANGEYVRFADGTQICSHQLTTSSTGSVQWIYPAPFSVQADAIQVTPLSSAAKIAHVNGFGSTVDILVNGYDTNGTRDAFNVSVSATGRWF